MADNTPQGGSASIATDDVTTLNGGVSSGVHVPRTKVGYGDDGSYRDASPAWPLPVYDEGGPSRQPVSLLIDNIAAVATEALISYGGFSNGTALTAGTAAFVVPAGRIFRLTGVVLVAQGTAIGTVRARVRSAATVSATSQHYLTVGVMTPANGGGQMSLQPDGGVEIPAGQQIGLTVVGLTTQTYTLSVRGFTYTAQ